MVRKVFYVIMTVGAVLYWPWWLALAAIIALAAILEPPYAVIAPALFFDWFYGAAGSWPVGLAAAALAVPLALLGKQLIRLN